MAKTAITISVNGKRCRWLRLRGDEPEFNFGYGVFETLRTYHGQPFAPQAHWQRLRRSARAISLKIEPTNDQLTNWLGRHCRRGFDIRLKLIAAPQRIYIISTPLRLNANWYRDGVKLCTYQSRRVDPVVKSLARIREYMANSYAEQHGCYDALLINERGQMVEGSHSNVYLVLDDKIITPPDNILLGVTREIILRLARPLYKIRFRPITRADLARATECFLTLTSAGVVPVRRIDSQIIGRGQVGQVTKQLMQLFQSYVDKRCSSARNT